MANKIKLQVNKLDVKTDSELMRLFPDDDEGFVQIGEAGYVFPGRFAAGLNEIVNMTIRPDDVFTVTYPRSGTTWSQELVWLINNDYDFETAKSTPLTERYPYIEGAFFHRPDQLKALQGSEEAQMKLQKELKASSLEQLNAATYRRFIKTHLPFSLLPPELLDTAKVVYVARDPRDVCVSFYHLTLLMSKLNRYLGDFEDYWNLFKRDLIMYTPFFAHLKEAWSKRNHPNMLFIFYEEMLQDLPSVIGRVSNFFGKTCSDEQVQALCEHLKFDNFSQNQAVQLTGMDDSGLLKEGEKFIRKGKSGGWREYFDEQMSQEAERWIRENLRDTDLRFPHLTTLT